MMRQLYFLMHRLVVLLLLVALAPNPNDEAISLSQVVQADGTLHLPISSQHMCTGWKITLDPALRAHFISTNSQHTACHKHARAAANAENAYWDNQLLLPGIMGRIRAVVVQAETVYVRVRFDFEQSRQTIYGLLRWETESGQWQVVGTPSHMSPPGGRAR